MTEHRDSVRTVSKLLAGFMFSCAHPQLLQLGGLVGETTAVPIAGPILVTCVGTCPSYTQDITIVPAAGGAAIKVTWTASGAEELSGVPATPLAYDTDYVVHVPDLIKAPMLNFHTETPTLPVVTVEVWPSLSTPQPPTLAWLVLTFASPIARADASTLALSTTAGAIIDATSLSMAATATVSEVILWGPFADPLCSAGGATPQLCAGHTYALVFAAANSSAGGPTANNTTASKPLASLTVVADNAPPVSWQSDGLVTSNDIGVNISRSVSRDCMLSGVSVAAPDPNAVEASAGETDNSLPTFYPFGSGTVVIGGLTPQSSYSWTLTCVDAAGNATDPWPVSFQTSLAENVVLSEVVVDPLADWRDADGGDGIPYDDTPGPGEATYTDEWSEVVNVGTNPTDISAWYVLVHDHPEKSETFARLLGKSTPEAYSPNGTTVLNQGDRFVGRIERSKKGPLDSAIDLYDDLGLLRDSITLGENGTPDGASTGPQNEAVARCPDPMSSLATDTWVATIATPALINTCP